MNCYQIQNRLFNAYAASFFLHLLFFEKRTPRRKRKYQEKQIRKLLSRAYNYPIYKEKFDRLGLKPSDFNTLKDLSKFPTLTKEEYRKWMQDELETEKAKNFKTTQTSGSTGIPTTNIYPPKEYAYHYVADLYGWVYGGYNPFWGLSLTRQPGDNEVGNKTLIQKLGILRRKTFDTRWERDKIIRTINEVKPNFILANSSELVYIAQYIIENNLSVHKPDFFCPTGENIDGRVDRLLRDVYGDGLINIYGGTEMADFAVKKPNSKTYDVIESLAYTCVKNEEGEIFHCGNGSLIVTPLFRKEYPLINYEIGDYVELREIDGCDCIVNISGRTNDVFFWRNGKQTIYKRLEDINMGLKDIFQIRFIQKSLDKVVIQVVKDAKSTKTIEELENYLSEQYEGQFGDDVTVEFDWQKELPPDSNGKLRVMVSEI